MAQLKDSVVQGSLRATDSLLATTGQFKIIMAPDGASSSNYTKGSTSGIGSILRSNGSQAYWGTVSASDLGAVQKSGDTMTGTLTVKGLKGTSNVDYGATLPGSPAEGQIFFQISDPWYELPAGGSSGQVLMKNSNDNYDVKWGSANSSINFDSIYPVGSIYMNMNLVDPSQLFGGTWERIQDVFLLGVGSTYAANGSGGSAKLTDVPYHRHGIPAHTGSAVANGDHSHDMTNGSTHRTLGDWYSTNSGSGPGLGYSGNSGWHLSTNGSHGHTVNIGAFNSDYTGTQNGVSILPPYITVYMWKRTA